MTLTLVTVTGQCVVTDGTGLGQGGNRKAGNSGATAEEKQLDGKERVVLQKPCLSKIPKTAEILKKKNRKEISSFTLTW